MKCKEYLRYLKSIAKADFKERTVINTNIVAIHREKIIYKVKKTNYKWYAYFGHFGHSKRFYV